jgi:hypothetical protein
VRFRCLACDGTYSDPGPDGMHYYHACPAEMLNARYQPDPTQPDHDPRATVPRPRRRDENLLPQEPPPEHGQREPRPARIRAGGAGAVPVVALRASSALRENPLE